MKLFISLLLSALVMGDLPAQSLDRHVISTGGFSADSDDVSISWTIGELVVASFNSSNLIIQQGFQQNDLNQELVTGLELPFYIHSILAYPNPSSDLLIVQILGENSAEMRFELSDLQGKKMLLPSIQISSTDGLKYHLDLHDIAPGYYLLAVHEQNNIPIKVFKLLKKQ